MNLNSISLNAITQTKSFKIALAMLLIAAPLSFIWHLEISMEFIRGVTLTNGWMDADPVQVYHAKMYAMLIVNAVTSFWILFNMEGKK